MRKPRKKAVDPTIRRIRRALKKMRANPLESVPPDQKDPILHISVFNLPRGFEHGKDSMHKFEEYLVERIQRIVGLDIEVHVHVLRKGLIASSRLKEKLLFDEDKSGHFKLTVEIVWLPTRNLTQCEAKNQEILRVINWEISNRNSPENSFTRVIQLVYELCSIPLNLFSPFPRDA